MNMQIQSGRIAYIDVLKAFAIFTVVFGHVLLFYGESYADSVYYALILPFHMPLFAFVSGLFVKPDTPLVPFLKSRLRSLVLPYVVWCAIVYIFIKAGKDCYSHFVYDTPFYFKPLFTCFWAAFIEWGWWFLRALFLSQVLLILFLKLFKKNILLGSLLSIVVLYLCSFTGILPNKQPFIIGFIFLHPFLVSGMLFKRYYALVEKFENPLFFSSLLIFVLCVYHWEGYEDSFYSMNTSLLETSGVFDITGVQVFYGTLFRFLTGLSGCLFFTLLFKKFRYSETLLRYLLPIGANTLGIYILHGFVFENLEKIFPIESDLLLFVFCLFFSIVILVSCYLIIRIIGKYKYLSLFLLGKKIK